jgi:hypothetical protein
MMRARVASLNQHRRSRTTPVTNEEKRARIEAALVAPAALALLRGYNRYNPLGFESLSDRQDERLRNTRFLGAVVLAGRPAARLSFISLANAAGSSGSGSSSAASRRASSEF